MAQLTKDLVVTVDPGTPNLPTADPVFFHLFGAPTPLGIAWRQKGSFPNSPDDFTQWSQVFRADDDGPLAPPARYYGPIAHMTYIVFPDVPVAENGFPTGIGPTFEGYFDVPTLSGVHREWRTYRKDGSHGTLTPYASSYSDPPHCTTGGPAAPVMFAGFTGRGPIGGRPDITVEDHNEGWNAGANSADALSGDVRTVFQFDIGPSGGGAVGFAAADRVPDNFGALLHAFHVVNTGEPETFVLESGVVRAYLGVWDPDDEFEIRRIAGSIIYRRNGVIVHQSSAATMGPLICGSALYRAGDSVL